MLTINQNRSLLGLYGGYLNDLEKRNFLTVHKM